MPIFAPMAGNSECVALLKEAGIKSTSNRILVLKTLLEGKGPMSMKEIETEVPTLDKSSIFRTLTTMREHDLLHVLDGGPDGIRYEVCHSHHNGPHTDEHVHFHCEACNRTFCFEQIEVPRIALPAEYEVHSTEHTIKGICPDCARNK